MATQLCIKRLQREAVTLHTNPPAHITARASPEDILQWHYLLEGPPGTPYEGGFYHGMIKFPTNFPYAPPSITMCTPSGRFHTNTRLCLSMSDFHPAEWNPMWSTSTILSGLLSFMTEETPTHGSMDSSVETRKRYAMLSPENNLKNETFVRIFPELVERLKALREERKFGSGKSQSSGQAGGRESTGGAVAGSMMPTGGADGGILFIKYFLVMLVAVLLSYFVL